jgi:hypothetical protein
MRILIVHDQFGESRSVAIPGHKVRSGDPLWRPTASELVAVVDIPDFPEGTDLEIALERIRGEFRLSAQRAHLIPKNRTWSGRNRGRSTLNL